MKNFLTTTVLGLLTMGIWAQDGFKDDFNTDPLYDGWYMNAHYYLSQDAGILHVNTNKSAMWASFGVNIPVSDVRTDPVVNLVIKTANPIQVSVWLFSDAANVLVTIPVMATTDFQTICFDYTGLDVDNEVLNAVKGIGIGFNGAALSWSGDVYLDEISLGTEAVKQANVGGLSDMVFFQGTTGHRVFIRGIGHATALSLSGADELLENVSFDEISSSGTSWLNFDCKEGANSSATVSLTATGASGYSDYSTTFQLEVEGNKIPTIDAVAGIQTSVGKETTITLTGISDGNGSVVQPVSISAESNNTGVIANDIDIIHDDGSSYATLTFTPAGAGTATLTVSLDDQQAADNLTQTSFDVEVLDSWNNKPTLQNIPNMEFLSDAGEQDIALSGISDGDDGSQVLIISASSSDPSIVPDPVVEYNSGTSGNLKLTPVAGEVGIVTITLTLNDDGGTTGNNGDQSYTETFDVEVYAPPLYGYVIPFTGTEPEAYDEPQPGLRDYWYVEGMDLTQSVSLEKEGEDDVFRIDCNGKSTWTGSWYFTPDMDLTNYPLLSMWVKCDQDIRFHLYFWDDSIRNNEDHHLEFDVPANTWTKLDFDFSTPGGMLNGDGELVNAKRIQRVLFNYHPSFGWPFTNWSGTVWFKDVRIGDESGITPTYRCTIDQVGPQTCFKGNETRTINLKGLSRTRDNLVSVDVTGKGVIAALDVSSVVDGEAVISYTPSAVGTDTLTVTVFGDAIDGVVPASKVIEIPVSVVDPDEATAGSPTIDFSDKQQVYRGFGATSPGSRYLDLYTTGGFGATAVRMGVFDNQIEPANDNGDPFVLDMSNLNKNAFNWNYVRGLKANGVETFLLTFWSPPAWMKENLSTNYQQASALTWENTINRVMPELYDEYAEDMVAAVKLFKQEAGVDLAAIGIQNEPAFCEPYPSAILGPDQFAEMIAIVGKRFEDEGISTKLYFAEQVGVAMTNGPVYSNQAYLTAVNANEEAKPYSDIFAIHGYASDGIQPGETPGSTTWANTFAAINANGKTRELWMTETEPGFSVWNDAFTNAANILTGFESGNVGLWTEWAWDGHCIDQGKPTQKYWAQSMYRHIKPGALRLTSASGNNDVLMTSWKNDAEHGNNVVMVLMNKGNVPLTVTLDQANLPGSFECYRCSENVDAFQDSPYIKGDKLLIGARSIVTLVSGSYTVPEIDKVADVQLKIDAGLQTIDLSGISDGNMVNENPVELGYSLSDNTIISGVSLSYNSPESTATFSYTPAEGGSTDVTIQVTSNGVTTEMSFSIQVNDYFVPHIDALTGDFNYEKGSGEKTISLSGINDGGDGGQTLSVSAAVKTSYPEGVVGNLSVNYTSPESTGSVSFTPNLQGSATIEVTVTDDGPEGKNSTAMSFTVIVEIPESVPGLDAEDILLYPNPVIDHLNVEVPDKLFQRFKLVTANGAILLNGKVNSSKFFIQTADLPQGEYFLVLEGSEGLLVKKFVK